MTMGQIINELGSFRQVCGCNWMLFAVPRATEVGCCKPGNCAASATRTRLANAPGVRGCSALRARADVFVVRYLRSANAMVAAPGVVACANPALRSSTATWHACGLGWVLRMGEETAGNRVGLHGLNGAAYGLLLGKRPSQYSGSRERWATA